MTFHAKPLWVQNPMRIRLDEIDRFVKIYDGIRY